MKTILSLFFCLLLVSSTFSQNNAVVEIIKEGIELHDAGKYKAALKKYEKAAKLDKKNPTIYYEMAYSYLAMKNYKKCIKNADKVIKLKKGHLKEAYVLKGTAYDNMGKPNKSIATYEEGLETFSDNYLLYYNLAITAYGINDIEKTKDALQNAIQYNDNHGSSHLVLANLQKRQNNKIQALLGYYFFLLIEPDTERSKNAYASMRKLLQPEVKKEGDNSITLNINLNLGEDQEMDGFATAEMMMSMNEALRIGEMTDSSETMNEFELFVWQSDNLFSTLSDLNEDQKEFYWQYYVSFFSELYKADQLETFCHYISMIEDKSHETWFQENETKLDTFIRWLNGDE